MVVGENCVAQVALMFAAADSMRGSSTSTRGCRAREDRQHPPAQRRAARAVHVATSPEAQQHAARHGAEAHGALMAGPLERAMQPRSRSKPATSQVAALIYTTGTTGNPKGVMLTHRNLLFIAAVSSTLRGLTPQDRAYGVLPISHVYGLASVMLGTLYAGACLYLAPRFSAAAMLRAIGDDQLTIMQGVPAMYARLLELTGGAPTPLPSHLRFIYAGGSPLDPASSSRSSSCSACRCTTATA